MHTSLISQDTFLARKDCGVKTVALTLTAYADFDDITLTNSLDIYINLSHFYLQTQLLNYASGLLEVILVYHQSYTTPLPPRIYLVG